MKIGILLSRVPYPLEKGDKLRAFYQIKELAKKNEVFLCALNVGRIHPKALEELSPYCSDIKIIQLNKISLALRLLTNLLFSNLPLQLAYFFQKRAKKKIQNFFIDHKVDHLFCQLIRVSEYVRDLKSIPKTLDYMDALSRGMERRISRSSFILRPFIQLETRRLKKYEHFIFNEFDSKCIISEQDRKLIVHGNNQELKIIPNGVNLNFFKAEEKEKEFDLLFTGNMSYPPNIDGVTFLIEKIMPLVWSSMPEVKVAIVGANPHPRVQRLSSNKVIVTGWVDDIRTYYSSTKVFIAPMQIGTGLQNKLLEAMAMKIPCITSSLANNALNATDQKNILIANQPEEYQASILDLLSDKEKRAKIAEESYTFVRNNYNWESTTKKLEALFLKSNQ